MTNEIDTYLSVFEALPVPYIVFAASDPDFTVVAENQAHAKVAMVTAVDIIGKPLLEAFPDTSEEYLKTGKSELLESIRKVIKTGKADTMDLLHYDIRNPDGSYAEKYWQVTHHPVKNKTNTVIAVCQATLDITNELSAKKSKAVAEAQLEQALTSGLVGFWSWDISEDIVLADRNLAKMFGLKPERVASGLPLQTFIETIHEEDRAMVQRLIEVSITQKKPYSAQYRLQPAQPEAEKSMRWVIAKGQLSVGEPGSSQRLAGVIVDITEQKLAEQDLSDHISFTDTITRSLGEGLYALDLNGKLTYMNNAAQKLLGWKESELLGKAMHDCMHYQDINGRPVAAKDCPLLSVIKTGIEVHRNQDAYTRKDGTIFPITYTSSPIYSGKKRIGAILAFSDITEQVAAKEELVKIANRQSFVAESSRILSSSLDYAKTLNNLCEIAVPSLADWCTVDLFNDQMKLELVAISHKDPQKISWAKQLREKQGPPDLSASNGIAQVVRTGKSEFYPDIPVELLEASAKTKAELALLKSLKMRSVIITPLREGKTVIGALTLIASTQQNAFTSEDLSMIEDVARRASMAITSSRSYSQAKDEIARRHKLEADLIAVNAELESRVKARTSELNQVNENLKRSNGELQDFAYVASHDLQEPLRKIQAFSNLLSEEYSAALGDGKDYVTRMQAAAARMSTLIEDLLSFSRVTTKAKPLVTTDLNLLVAEVLGDLETRISETAGTVTVGNLPTIKADPLQMRQLFQNLIGNALKFHKPDQKPVVQVSAKTYKAKNGSIKSYVLYVKDNGVGFDERYLDRIFAVFQRLYGREQYSGTGIGLAICRKIAERHKGSITATSSIGKGSTFIVTLPAKVRKDSHDGHN